MLPIDVVVILFWVAVVFGFRFCPDGDPRGFYRKHRVPLSPPGWVFGVVWAALYACIAGAGVMFYYARPHDVWQYTVGGILLICNIPLNKAWTPLFFAGRQTWLAAADALAICLTAVGFCVTTAWIGWGWEDVYAWIAFGLFVPYVLWTAFATFLSLEYALGWDKTPHKHHERH